MANEISEGNLILSFEGALSVERFDGASHGMSHVMKAVDFVVTFPSETWLVEVKDFNNPDIPPEHKAARATADYEKVRTEALYRDELAPKLRDTLIYLALANCAPANVIKYIVLIETPNFDSRMFQTGQDRLRTLCYLPGPRPHGWASSFDIVVANFDQWNKRMHPHSIRRN